MSNEKKTPLLIVDKLSKSFGEKKVLQDVCLSINQGESTVIIGSSGQGKSVLIKCICGLILPDIGSSIIIDGSEVAQRYFSERKPIEQGGGVSFLFQSNALFDSMTVRENIFFALKNSKNWDLGEENDNKNKRIINFKNTIDINKYFRRDSEKKSKNIMEGVMIKRLEEVGLDHKVADLYPKEISGGMQKRAALARALAINPRIIFCDEPTSGLDPLNAQKIAELMREIQQSGRTIISISHDPIYTHTVADQILYIGDKGAKWVGKEIFSETEMNFVSYFLR